MSSQSVSDRLLDAKPRPQQQRAKNNNSLSFRHSANPDDDTFEISFKKARFCCSPKLETNSNAENPTHRSLEPACATGPVAVKDGGPSGGFGFRDSDFGFGLRRSLAQSVSDVDQCRTILRLFDSMWRHGDEEADPARSWAATEPSRPGNDVG